MSFRKSARLLTKRAARRRLIAGVVSGLMVAGLVQASTLWAHAERNDNEPAAQQQDPPAPARPAPPAKPRKADGASKLAAAAPVVRWPAAGSATLALAGRTPAKASAGGLAVTLTPTASKAIVGKGAGAAASRAAAEQPASVRVETLDRAASTGAGVDGPVLKVLRADSATGAGKPLTLSVDYRGFAGAYGGDFGARLRLVRLPDCALTTPQLPACKPQPVPATNDTETATVNATVSAGARQTLFALTAAESSTQGNYGATALAPSAKWSVAPSSGGYSWEYPITAPQVPGGLVPGVALAYNSQTVDGRTTTTNNQGSWVGEGFSYEPGYVERQYNACRDDGHDTSADLCWAYDNATIMLNGRSNTLIRSGAGWRFSTDDGSKIERSPGGTNGDNDGEFWVVTTADGTKYHFGLNRLPGWTTGKEETASVWTVPVFGDDKTNAEDDVQEPCYQATFANASCQQAWRWNLDHVVDVHGNVTSYFYEKEANSYALGGKLDVNGTAYTRGGFLKRIDYGQRAGAVYSTNAAARVVFDTQERCKPTSTFACKPADLTAATAASWQDTPFDRICAVNKKCTSSQLSPSFFTRKRLTGITTQVRAGATWVPVDGWSFDHIFTNNGDGSRSLWLHTITHSGYGGTNTPLTLPTVTLDPLQLPNRIDIPNDDIAPLVRPRLSTVYTESGAQIDVNYADADCSADKLPSPGRSTRRCYPVKWSPGGEKKPITDWFHKYVVKQVIESDRVGGSPDQVTRYTYLDDAGWRYADASGLSKDESDYLSWSQWRGYRQVVVTEGDGQTMPTKSRHTYLRGLDGDKDPDGGTRAATREDSTGTRYTDADELSGFEIETEVYDGDDIISTSMTSPWRHQTASVKHAWGTDRATFVLPEVSRGRAKLANGAWRETKAVTTYDAGTGRAVRVDDRGDASTDTDDRCTRTYFADNATAGIRNLVSRKETVAVDCAATPDRATQVIADERTYYDGKGFGDDPITGNATRTEKLARHDGSTASYVTIAESTFDDFGRPKVVKDGVGTATTINYTEVDGLTTTKKETGPLGDVTTEYAPTSAQPIAQVDMNKRRTDLAYDQLGRLVSVWLPDRPKSGPANVKYTYSFVKDKPVHVKTEKIKIGETYRAEYQIYDGFLRPRQMQAEGLDGGRLIADTFYTPTGKIAKVNDTYYAAGAASGEILPSRNGDVDGQTAFVYDGADRQTNAITLRAGDEKWRTVTRYDGADRVSVDPPTGATPTTTVTDARGQTVQLLQYKGPGPAGAADTTHYTYTDSGQLATVTDAAGNVWRHSYDQRGREIKTVDPDAGTSTSAYDDLDRPVSTTDARGITLSTTYDSIGRKTATYSGDPKTGTMLSSWTFDTVAKGELYASTRYVNGNKYEVRVPRLDALNRPLETQYAIPKADVGDKLGGLYRFFTVYNSDGTVQSTGFPEAGGMPAEAVAYLYNGLQQVTKIQGKNTYATNFTYAQTGELLKTEVNTGGRKAWATAAYEQGTKRLINAGVTRQAVIVPGGPPDTTPVNDVDQKYTYDDAGNVSSIEDTPATGQRDIQCFGHDYLRRMTEAWTSASTAEQPCAGGAEATGVGGVAPYHESYTFDSTGNRLTRTSHAIGETNESTQQYTYPAAKSDQPHAVASMTEKTAAGDRLYSYKYDAAGNTIKRNRVGVDQDLDWDAEGNLASVTEAGKTTSFVYSADGQRLVRKEPGTTTVYLAGMELRMDTGTTAVSGTRFYPVSGQAMVVRTVTGLQFQFADSHGTSQVAVDAVSGEITHRRMDPYGNPRGKQPDPAAWSGEKGFVGGNQDTSTGLTQLGARLYDSQTARFVSVDPIIDVNDPQQMNAYAYANNSPATFSDASGLRSCSDDRCGPGADFVDLNGDYHSVPGHNDGCGGCSGADDPNKDEEPYVAKSPRVGHSSGASSTKSREQREAEARVRKAKEMLVEAGKALGQIVMDELGITDALACVTRGDLGGCAETVLNIAGTFVGGVVAKLARKYGAPWKWKKAAELGRKLWDLGAKIVNGIKTWMKESKLARALVRCNSFAPGTLVLVAHGKWKRIEDLKTGDVVVATDPQRRHATVDKTVVATHVTVDTEFTDLTVVDAAGRRSVLHTTQHHPFWDAGSRVWRGAGELVVGAALLTSQGSLAHVAAVNNFTGQATMYNLTVNDIHTYYVMAGSTPVLVHNCSEQQVADHLSAAFPDRNIRQNRDVFREDGSQLTDHDVYDDDFVCEVACGGGTGKVAQMQNNILPSANGARVAVYGPRLKGSVVKGIEAQGVPVFRSLDDLSAWVGPKS